MYCLNSVTQLVFILASHYLQDVKEEEKKIGIQVYDFVAYLDENH